MCNRNATASWSGYSHQGQVGLLVALRMLQEPSIDLNTHFLEYESREDVAIYVLGSGGNKKYLSVHQVKAFYSGNNSSKIRYNNVLNGTFDVCGNDFLHTVVSIIDWNSSATTNINSIKRYDYERNVFHCNTIDIESYLKLELRKLLGNNEGLVTSALQRLSYRLDCKIRAEHSKAERALFDISFSLRQIDEIVRDTSAFEASNICLARKGFYELYFETVKNGDYDNEHFKRISDTIIEPLYLLSDQDFMSFLQRLSFDETPKRMNEYLFIFKPDGFRNVFFKSLMEILLVLPKIEDTSVKYQKGGNPEKFLVTTIMQKQKNARFVVENIIRNSESQNILWDNHSLINDDISGTLTELNPNIMNVTSGEQQENKFMSYSSRNRLVTVEEAKIFLNND
jgi:hypothetical protein